MSCAKFASLFKIYEGRVLQAIDVFEEWNIPKAKLYGPIEERRNNSVLSKPHPPDMVDSKALVNGRIYSSFYPRRVNEALVTLNGRVAYIGNRSAALNCATLLGSEIIDLQGKVAIPGFVDSHMHLDGLGSLLENLDLRGCGSIRELKERTRDYAREHKGSDWIIGRGWDQELFDEKRFPTRWDLDEAVGERPVSLIRICTHAAVLNSKALEEIELPPESPRVQRDKDGEPTGIVTEEMLGYVEAKSSGSMTAQDRIRQLREGLRHCVSQGVTTLDFVSCSMESFKALQVLRKEGELPARVRVHLAPEALDTLRALGVRGGYGDDMLKIVGIKAFADGSLGARTAWLSFPYADDPDNSGTPCIGGGELMEIARSAEELDLQLATHGIGDRAIDLILSVYGRIKKTGKLRHRIEHCSIVRSDQVTKMKELGIVATIQPHYVITDWWITKRVGEGKANYAYAFKTLLENGIRVGINTDCPVEPLNPWETVYATVTRGVHEGVPLAKNTPEQKLTLEEALSGYTCGSAYTMNEEDDLGTLDRGKFADFVTLETDPFSVDAKDIRDLKISETYVGGCKVFPAA